MNYKDCKAHPTWFEPAEWVGMENKTAEFALISPHPSHRLHSQLNNTSLRKNMQYQIENRFGLIHKMQKEKVLNQAI